MKSEVTAAEQVLNGLYNSYVLLAVPLFILAADLMNVGSLTDRLLKFCLVLVGRFRGGLGHVNVVSNVIFAGMSGSAIADAVGLVEGSADWEAFFNAARKPVLRWRGVLLKLPGQRKRRAGVTA